MYYGLYVNVFMSRHVCKYAWYVWHVYNTVCVYVCVCVCPFLRFPLTHRSFYDGPWSTVYRNMIDYIVFPMSFVVLPANLTYPAAPPWSPLCEERCLRATQLLLSVGVQDRDGWLARLSLGRLLDSLVPVNDYDYDNDSSRHHQPPPSRRGRRGRP